MRFFIVFILFALVLNGDEIKRMESIVSDISELRGQIEELKNKLQNKEILLKTKEKIIYSLKNKKIYIKPKEIVKYKECKVVVDKPNGFPKLILKDKYQR